jgi:hypothetical protein
MKRENKKEQPNRPGDDLAQRYAEILRLRTQIKEAKLALANPNWLMDRHVPGGSYPAPSNA